MAEKNEMMRLTESLDQEIGGLAEVLYNFKGTMSIENIKQNIRSFLLANHLSALRGRELEKENKMIREVTREEAESAVFPTDCSGRKYSPDEREDLIRYVLLGAEMQRGEIVFRPMKCGGKYPSPEAKENKDAEELFPPDIDELLKKLECPDCEEGKVVRRGYTFRVDCPTCKGTGLDPYRKMVVVDVDAQLPDNIAWHHNEREFEAFCAGRNILVSAGWIKRVCE